MAYIGKLHIVALATATLSVCVMSCDDEIGKTVLLPILMNKVGLPTMTASLEKVALTELRTPSHPATIGSTPPTLDLIFGIQ